MRRNLPAKLLALFLITVMGVTPVRAFSSVTPAEIAIYLATGKPGGYIHRQITEEGLTMLNIKKDVIDLAGDWVWRVDWLENEKSLWPRPNKDYFPSHHFDRNQIATCDGCETRHAEAFLSGAKYLREQKLLAVAALKEDRRDDAVEAIGRGLHALQDAVSHSNIVDLSRADLAVLKYAMLNAAAPPAALKMAGYDLTRGADLERTPCDECLPGRDFGHDICSKDEPAKNKESQKFVQPGSGSFDAQFPRRTKFAAARALAVTLTRDWTGDIRRETGEKSWSALVDKNAAAAAAQKLGPLAHYLSPAGPPRGRLRIGDVFK